MSNKKQNKKKKEGSSSDSSSSDDQEPENLSYKIIVLGNPTVGKTQIICRYCEDSFSKNYKKTIGVDFFQKRIEINDNTNVSLQIWDIDGEALSGKMLDTYVHDANAIIFVYDVTNQSSFTAIEYWNREISLLMAQNKEREAPIKVVLGNKSDLNHLSVI